MYTIIGLGNPGVEYEKTRHNTGRILVQELAKRENIELKVKKDPAERAGSGEAFGEGVRLSLPDTFMNKSGKVAGRYAKSPKAAKGLIVIHDDLDLPLGAVKVSFGSSSGGHNGVESVQRAVKSKEFTRIRVGVSKTNKGKMAKPKGEKAVLDYLLGNFLGAEHKKLVGPIKERVFDALEAIVTQRNHIAGMNAVNGLPPVK